MANPIKHRGLGIRFVASPRHADLLLVTGPVSKHMAIELKRTYDATPDPKLVVAVGDCGCSGGIFGESYASLGRVSNVIPVDVAIPGCPPAPVTLLQGTWRDPVGDKRERLWNRVTAWANCAAAARAAWTAGADRDPLKVRRCFLFFSCTRTNRRKTWRRDMSSLSLLQPAGRGVRSRARALLPSVNEGQRRRRVIARTSAKRRTVHVRRDTGSTRKDRSQREESQLTSAPSSRRVRASADALERADFSKASRSIAGRGSVPCGEDMSTACCNCAAKTQGNAKQITISNTSSNKKARL